MVRVPDPWRWGKLPAEGVLGVQDLPEAVARIGLRSGDPVFVRADGMVDVDLLDFVRSKEFRSLAGESKRNCATDIRLLLEFLSSRGVPWPKATVQDLADFRNWRCEAAENPHRIGGTKWNREAAAFTAADHRWTWCRLHPQHHRQPARPGQPGGCPRYSGQFGDGCRDGSWNGGVL